MSLRLCWRCKQLMMPIEMSTSNTIPTTIWCRKEQPNWIRAATLTFPYVQRWDCKSSKTERQRILVVVLWRSWTCSLLCFDMFFRHSNRLRTLFHLLNVLSMKRKWKCNIYSLFFTVNLFYLWAALNELITENLFDSNLNLILNLHINLNLFKNLCQRCLAVWDAEPSFFSSGGQCLDRRQVLEYFQSSQPMLRECASNWIDFEIQKLHSILCIASM